MTVGDHRSIMVCRLTVLIALLAQGLASMSPACFVRCVASNGHECIELVGQDCHCGELGLFDHDHSTAACCSAHHHADDQDVVETLLSSQTDCRCSHSLLDFGPQSPAKSLVADQLSDAQLIWLAALPVTSENVVALERAGLSPPLLRPQVSPHLAFLATIVLRV